MAAREREVLPTSYFHVAFSVPHELNVFALENPRAFYDLFYSKCRLGTRNGSQP